MLKIEIAKRAAKFLKTIPAKHARQLALKLQALRAHPNPPDSATLKGHAPYLRADMGEYRIIYFVADETLKIDLVGKRNDDEVYRKMKRL